MTHEPLDTLYVDPQTYTRECSLPDASLLRVYDTTLRDGEQMPGLAFSPEDKVELAKRLSRIGCHIIDMGFPAASASDRAALRLVMRARQRAEIRSNVEILVMCRAAISDIASTIQTLRDIGVRPDEVSYLIFTSSSPLHCKYKLGPTLLRRENRPIEEWMETPTSFFHEANKAMVAEAIEYALAIGATNIEFGCEDASRTPIDCLKDLIATAVRKGARRYIFADTTGCLSPEAAGFYCRSLTEMFPNLERVSHFHNDFGLAVANTIVGVMNGFTTFSTTVNGIGERAGNVPLHSIVVALRYLYGLEIRGFQYSLLPDLARFVEAISGIVTPPQEPVIGSNAFTHESGIHTHGVSVSRTLYEAIPFEDVGASARVLYGKHSGLNSIISLLERNSARLGVETDRLFASELLAEVKALRERAAYHGDARRIADQYQRELRRIGFAEEDVLNIAERLLEERASAQKGLPTPDARQAARMP